MNSGGHYPRLHQPHTCIPPPRDRQGGVGIATVAVYLQADRESLPVRLAERTVRIGLPPAKDSSAGIAAGLNRPCAISAQALRHIQRAVGRLGNRPCCGFHDFAAAGDNKVVRMPELDWPIELTSSRREPSVGS